MSKLPFIIAMFITASCTHTDLVSTDSEFKSISNGLRYYLPMDKFIVTVVKQVKSTTNYIYETNKYVVKSKKITQYTLSPSLDRRGDPAFAYSLRMDVGNSSSDDLTLAIDNKNLLTNVTFKSEGKGGEVIKSLGSALGSFTPLAIGKGDLSTTQDESFFKAFTEKFTSTESLNSINKKAAKKSFFRLNLASKYALQESSIVRQAWLDYVNELAKEESYQNSKKSIVTNFIKEKDSKNIGLNQTKLTLSNTLIENQKKQTAIKRSEFLSAIAYYLSNDGAPEGVTTENLTYVFDLDEIPATGTARDNLPVMMKALFNKTDSYYTASINGKGISKLFPVASNSLQFLENTEKSKMKETYATTPPECRNSSCVFYRNSVAIDFQLVNKDNVIKKHSLLYAIPRYMLPNYVQNVTSTVAKNDLTLTFNNGELKTLHKVNSSSAEQIAKAVSDATTNFITNADSAAKKYSDYQENINKIKNNDLQIQLDRKDLESKTLAKDRLIAGHDGNLALDSISNDALILKQQKEIDLYESVILKANLANQVEVNASQRTIAAHELNLEIEILTSEINLLNKKRELDGLNLSYEDQLKLSALQSKQALLKENIDAVNLGVKNQASLITSITAREKTLTDLLNAYKDNTAKTEELKNEIKKIHELLENK